MLKISATNKDELKYVFSLVIEEQLKENCATKKLIFQKKNFNDQQLFTFKLVAFNVRCSI